MSVDGLATMSLKGTVIDDMKNATRSRDVARLPTLRLLVSAIRQHEIDVRDGGMDDGTVIQIVRKMIKQREESAEMYSSGGRQELADRELLEIEVLREYLPDEIDAAAIGRLVGEAIAEAGAESPKDMGKVMRLLKSRTEGRADMSEVSRKVKEHLGG